VVRTRSVSRKPGGWVSWWVLRGGLGTWKSVGEEGLTSVVVAAAEGAHGVALRQECGDFR
jgi:hypothetical protein